MPHWVLPMQIFRSPLGLRKPSAAQLSGLVEQLAARLPTWKAATLPKSGRLVLVLSVLCSIPIHSMLALDLPAKTITAINKIIRAFLWELFGSLGGSMHAKMGGRPWDPVPQVA